MSKTNTFPLPPKPIAILLVFLFAWNTGLPSSAIANDENPQNKERHEAVESAQNETEDDTRSPRGGFVEESAVVNPENVEDVDDPDKVDDTMAGQNSGSEGSPQSTAIPTEESSPSNPSPGNQSNCSAPLIAIIDSGCEAGICEETLSVIGEDPSDSSGHGTSVAQMVLGQNPQARILSIKAFDEEGCASDDSICAAMRAAMSRGATIINLSFSVYAPEGRPAVSELVDEAVTQGIRVVAAAGNCGADASEYCPAQIESAITVGALGQDGRPLSTSNLGLCVDAWVAASSTSYAAAIITGQLSLTGESGNWIESPLVNVENENFETTSLTSDTSVVNGRFQTAFSHAILSLTTHYAYEGNVSASGSSAQTSPSVSDHNAQAIMLNISGAGLSGGVAYRADPYGPSYLSWVSNGQLAGTTGESRPLQRIQAKLTGDYAKAYSIQYRYYRINYDPGIDGYDYVKLGPDPGWTNWASDGGDPTGLGTVTSRWITSIAFRLVARSYTHTIQIRYQNPDGTFGNWSNARSGSYAFGATVPAWTRQSDNAFNEESMSAYTAGFESTVKQIDITRKSYYLDVNGRIDGKDLGNCSPAGSFSLSINGRAAANSTADYYAPSLSDSTWEISNVQANPGYTFDGVVEGSASGILSSGNTQAARLSFHTNTYSVAFDGNECTEGNMPRQNMTCHEARALSPCAFKRQGYSFLEWNTERDGTGRSFQDASSIENLTLEDKATIVLYAQWEKDLELPRSGVQELNGHVMGSAAIASCGFACSLAWGVRAKRKRRVRGRHARA